MTRKKRVDATQSIIFDVVYEDGARTSNRKVPSADLNGLDDDASARAVIEAQDRRIAELSGSPPGRIKSVSRSPR